MVEEEEGSEAEEEHVGCCRYEVLVLFLFLLFLAHALPPSLLPSSSSLFSCREACLFVDRR